MLLIRKLIKWNVAKINWYLRRVTLWKHNLYSFLTINAKFLCSTVLKF